MNTQTTQGAATVPASKPLVAKLKIPGILLAIVALEWLLAFLLMPSTSAVAPLIPVTSAEVAEETETSEAPEEDSDHAAATPDDSGHGAAAPAGKAASKVSDSEEVDLGSYTVSGFQPASNSTLFVTFHLYGTVRHKYVREFEQRLEESQHRIRDNIIVIIRSAEITDLTDAGLGLIKRRILETTNKTLGKPLLQEVVFSEFSCIEQ